MEHLLSLINGLEITFNQPVEYAAIGNPFSEHKGSEVVKVPVIGTNTSESTSGLNMFFVTIYDSQGIKLDSVS